MDAPVSSRARGCAGTYIRHVPVRPLARELTHLVFVPSGTQQQKRTANRIFNFFGGGLHTAAGPRARPCRAGMCACTHRNVTRDLDPPARTLNPPRPAPTPPLFRSGGRLCSHSCSSAHSIPGTRASVCTSSIGCTKEVQTLARVPGMLWAELYTGGDFRQYEF
jgi:hypothetical protein